MRVMRDLVGETLSNRYRLIARLAGGGMGEVYRGHDLLLDRPVAVKVLQPSLAKDEELVARFKAEARAAARLSHPNVVAVYDWGAERESTYYMVMEYVSGSDLREALIAHTVLDPGQAAAIVASVCDALSAAHATGLIHRDIKPENILIDRSGSVKVADFGIAVLADADRTAPGGAMPGTLRYLSPEQARGQEATAASDIWGAGAVLHELVTGTAPQQGTGSELLRKRAEEPPPRPSRILRDIPREIDDIVMRACSLQPEDRYASAAEMAQSLRTVVEMQSSSSEPIEALVNHVTGEIRLPDMEETSMLPRAQRRSGRRRRGLRRAIVAAVLFSLAAVGASRAIPAVLGPKEVRVPRLVGLAEDAAIAKARDLGFGIAVGKRMTDFSAPRGEVLVQKPARGLLEEGSTIELIVSKGLPRSSVPDLTGMGLSTARVRLRASELEPGKVTRRFDRAPEGTVIAQSKTGGKLRWGSAVALVVSKGPRPIDMPEVAGLPVKKAGKILKDAGFDPVVVTQYSDDVKKGIVIGTNPPAGQTAPDGSKVDLIVSAGPEFKKLKLPDVRNMALGAARSKLESLKLRVEVFQSCGGGGKTVIDTDPLPGTTVRENDVIALFVC